MFLLLLASTVCWWFGAHTMVAQIASDMLTHEQRLWLTKLFSTWPSEECSIINASLWQDDLKSSNLYMMWNWHFSDQPVIKPGFTPEFIPTSYNVTCALTEAINSIMLPTTTSLWSLHFFMRNLLHFMGDIHQPLHSSAYFSEEYPTGDSGGNFIKIKCSYGSACDNLHFAWDSALLNYQFNDSEAVLTDFLYNVSLIKKKYPPSTLEFDAENLDVMNMNNEAHSVAEKFVYGALPENLVLADEYFIPGRVWADKMISLAGHRLGRILQNFFNTRGLLPFVETPPFSVREGIAWAIDCVLLIVIVVYSVLVFRKRKENEDERLMLQYS